MPHEEDVRAALRALASHAPSGDAVLAGISARSTRRRRPIAFVLAPVAAAAAVVAVIAASVAISDGAQVRGPAAGPGTHVGPACTRAKPTSVPTYYLAISGYLRNRLTGKTVARVAGPSPYRAIVAVTGAADDRTFVLAGATGPPGASSTAKLFVARFNPVNDTVSVTPLPIPVIPATSQLTGLALSPNGTHLATAIQSGRNHRVAVLRVYSLAGGKAKMWRTIGGTIGYANNDGQAISWSCTGTLAFNWQTRKPADSGVWLLNTSTASGGLLVDSRYVVHTEEPAGQFSASWDGVLTPDGTKIVVPMRLGGRYSAQAEFEEFSATSGKPIRVLYRVSGPANSPTTYEFLDWTNSSGSVLVVGATPKHGSGPVYGVLSGTRFVRISGAPPAELPGELFAF
jgi:hypothetical protein